MDKQTEYRTKRVQTNSHKKEDKYDPGVYLTKLMGVSKLQTGSGLITLDKLFVLDSVSGEKPSAAIFMVFGYHIKNVHPLCTSGTKVIMLADPRIDDYEELRANENKEKPSAT